MAFKVVSLLLSAGVLLSLTTLGAANPIQERIFVPEEVTEDEGNAWEKSGFFEGDIILDEKYFRNGKLLGNRQPARFPGHSIPYEIAGGFDGGQRAAIMRAFEEYHQKSCIRFRPKNQGDRDWILIQDNGSGCNAQVGRVGGRQYVNLKRSAPGGGCFNHGIIVHELLHSLGFWHQQSSTDRDNYVNIEWGNIQPGQEVNFQKYGPNEVTSFGVPYDYGSVLHYGPTAFSKNGRPTIVPKQRGVSIGQTNGLSPRDVQKLKIMYGC